MYLWANAIQQFRPSSSCASTHPFEMNSHSSWIIHEMFMNSSYPDFKTSLWKCLKSKRDILELSIKCEFMNCIWFMNCPKKYQEFFIDWQLFFISHWWIHELFMNKYFMSSSLPELALVAQLDARPTGDQVVTGSIPAEVGNILSWRLIMKYFYGHSLPSADSRRAVSCQFLAKECAQYWLTA